MEVTAGINGMLEAEQYPHVIDLTAPSPGVQNSTRSNNEERATNGSVRLPHNPVQSDSSQPRTSRYIGCSHKALSPCSPLHRPAPSSTSSSSTASTRTLTLFFAPGSASVDEKVTHSRLLKLVSFNCKNNSTCEYVMDVTYW